MAFFPEKYTRYIQFFEFILKYANRDIIQTNNEFEIEDNDDKINQETQEAKELVEDLKKMGPTYIKLGQLLSTRPDLLPDTYLEELATLQDDVEDIPFEKIEKIVQNELGAKMSKLFKEFNNIPLASASIGQVHEAILHSGKKVAVKIQRPGIRKKISEELQTLQDVADLAFKHSKTARKYALNEVIDELGYTLINELNYKDEAQNLIRISESLEEFKHLIVPLPYMDFTTSKVLTMDFIDGRKVTEITAFTRLENDLNEVLEQLIKSYLKLVIVDGIAHADPHPGNVKFTRENQLALIDMGMVAKFGKSLQDYILRIMVALSQFDGAELSKTLLEMSEYNDKEANIRQFKKEISRLVQDSENKNAKEMDTGRIVVEMNRVAAMNGIKIPVELNILGKILLNIDRIVAVLNPEYNLQQTIEDYVQELMQKKMVKELKPENTLSVLLASKNLTENLPDRLNRITENLANNELQIKVDAIDENRFTDAFQKVANRITVGLIIAAMIVGAALLIQVPTEFKILGYPALAIIMFMIAAFLGFFLIYTIIKNDESFRIRKH